MPNCAGHSSVSKGHSTEISVILELASGHGGESTHKMQDNFWQWNTLKELKQEMGFSNGALRWGGLLWCGGQEEHFKKYIWAKPWMMRRAQLSKDKSREGIPGRGKIHCKVQRQEWAQHVSHTCPFPGMLLHRLGRGGIYSCYKYTQMLEPTMPGFISRLWPWESHPTRDIPIDRFSNWGKQ